jgi:hypothetical protein
MRKSPARSWVRIVLCYWLLMSVVFFLEFTYMESDWAGLPGFLLTLPLSTLVVGLYFLASYAAEFRGYNIHITDYYAEFGFIVCAFLNAFIFYPVYLLRVRRKTKVFDPPPPPNIGMQRTRN